jgi:hypothetical protein
MKHRSFSPWAGFSFAVALSACTLLANGKINRRLEVEVGRGRPEARLVIEDLEASMRSIDGLIEVRTPLEGRASQIVFSADDPRRPCFAIDDYLALDQLAMLQGNPYGDMDFVLERSDGVVAKKFERSELHDETFDVAFVVRGSEEEGYAPQELSNKLLRVQATVCFTTPEPFITPDTAWVQFRAGVSRYTFRFG